MTLHRTYLLGGGFKGPCRVEVQEFPPKRFSFVLLVPICGYFAGGVRSRVNYSSCVCLTGAVRGRCGDGSFSSGGAWYLRFFEGVYEVCFFDEPGDCVFTIRGVDGGLMVVFFLEGGSWDECYGQSCGRGQC